MNFINPAPFGNKDVFLSSSKKLVMNSYPGQKVVSPFDGVVSDTNIANKTIEIEHMVNGTKYYSELIGVENFYVANGYRVRQGDIVGFFGSGPLEYIIYDKSGNKENLKNFFEYDSMNKDENNLDTKEKEKSKIEVDLGVKGKEDLPGLYSAYLNILTSPFAIVGSALKGDLIKKKKEKEEKVNEQINRIKNLLK